MSSSLGDLGGGGIGVGRDRAGDGVVGHLGSAAGQFLDEDGDRRVGTGRGQVPGHLPHRDRVAGDQPDQAASGLVAGLRVESQDVVVVEVPEPHQAGAALRVPDQRGELLVGGTGRQLGEQRPDVRLADTAVDAVQDGLERPVAGEHVAAYRYVEDVFGCHRLLPL